MVIVESLNRAIARVQAWLASQDSPEATIVAHEAGLAESDADARRWTRRLLDAQDDDGSWGGALVATAETLLTLHELRAAAALKEQDPGIGRALDWLSRRQGAPGAWTDGCDEARHEAGYCHHFMGGFYAPAPPEVPQEAAVLGNGTVLQGDAEIRFGLSAITLRGVLAWKAGGGDAKLHLAGLRQVVRDWVDRPPVGLGTAALLSAVTTLVRPGTEEDAEAVRQGLRLVAARQRGDGSWVDADAFQALEALGAAVDADIEPARTRRALWHGARLLISTQHADGSWGREFGTRRALIAWRTFRRVDAERG